jgi:molecular chaperone HscC
VHIRFTYDLNGILEVEALVPSTGRKYAAVFTNHVKNLREEAVKEAVAKMQALKVYPREDLGNRRLLLFAERVYGEVSQWERERLDEAMTAFEAAMNSGDRRDFDETRATLIAELDRLGHAFEEGAAPGGDDAP